MSRTARTLMAGVALATLCLATHALARGGGGGHFGGQYFGAEHFGGEHLGVPGERLHSEFGTSRLHDGAFDHHAFNRNTFGSHLGWDRSARASGRERRESHAG